MEAGNSEGSDELALLHKVDPSLIARSDSFQDVKKVAGGESDILGMKRPFSPFVGAVPTPTADPSSKKSKLSSVCRLAEGLKALQEHENDLAEVVVVCEPEQASLMMGGLHPRGSLYERPVNIDVAKAQHAEFRTQVSDLST